MKAAIENFNGLKADKKAVILGDMFELGEESQEEHKKLGQLLKASSIDSIFLCGKEMKVAKEELPNAQYFPSRTELEQAVKTDSLAGYYILIKGSRGMGLEKLLEVIN